MDTTGMTVVSQLLTGARSRHGAHAVAVLQVAPALLDEVMDHVVALGGQVDLDSCVVEGVEIRELPPGVDVPQVLLHGETTPRPAVDEA